MSMVLTGEIRGIRHQQNGDFTFYHLVIEDSGFKSHQVQLSKSNVENGFVDKIEKLQGKTCHVPFYIRQYSGKNGQGFSLNYDGDKLPAEHRKPVAAAASS